MALNFTTTPVDLTLKYKVVARYMDGVKVIGYGLVDNAGNKHLLPKDVVENLALSKNIVNCTAQRYKNVIVMKGTNCKLTQLPVIEANSGKVRGADEAARKKVIKNQVTLVGRIINGKATIGYVVRTPDSNEKKISRDKVLTLARQGKVSNARAQLYGDKLILRGVGLELTQLPVSKIV